MLHRGSSMSEAQRDGEVNRVAVAELADVGGGPTMEPQEETKQSGRTVTCCASVTLPDGIDGEALQCQFDCGSFKSVPAVYSGGRVVCRVPADEVRRRRGSVAIGFTECTGKHILLFRRPFRRKWYIHVLRFFLLESGNQRDYC